MRGWWTALVSGLTLAVGSSLASAESAPDLAALEKSGCAAYRSTEAVIPACTEAINRWPSLAAAYAMRGNAYRLREDYQSALADFDKSLELAPGNAFSVVRRALVYHAIKDRRATDELRKLIASTPTDARGFEARGLAFMNRGMLDAALGDVAQGLKLLPDDLLLHATRASVLLRKQEFNAALGELDTVIAAAPNASLQYFQRGGALSRLMQPQAAMESFAKAVDLDPHVPHFSSVKRQEEIKQARLSGEASVGSSPSIANRETARSSFRIGILYLRAGEFRKALKELDAAIGSDPTFGDALLARAAVHIKLREIAPARTDIDQVLAINPRSAPALAMRGEIKANSGDADGALADFENALAVEPKHAVALAGRGWVRLKKGKNEAAKQDFSAAIAASPSNVSARLGMAEAYLQTGNRDAAVKALEAILADNPEIAQARDALRRAKSYASRNNIGPLLGAPMRVLVVRAAQKDCSADCPEWISAEGLIDDAAVEQFKSTIARLGRKKLPVFVSSSGGWANAGIELGQLIRDHGLEVFVTRTEILPCKESTTECNRRAAVGVPAADDAHCESACAFVLAGGLRRGVGSSAVVGVHAPTRYLWRRSGKGRVKIVDAVEAPKSATSKAGSFFGKMGISSTMTTLLRSTPRQSMYWLSREELRSTRIMTDEMDGEQLIAQMTRPSWTVEEQRAAAAAARADFSEGLKTSDAVGQKASGERRKR